MSRNHPPALKWKQVAAATTTIYTPELCAIALSSDGYPGPGAAPSGQTIEHSTYVLTIVMI